MSGKRRIGVLVAVSLAVVAGSLIGFLASHARAAGDAAAAAPKTWTAAATLKKVSGAGRGTFTGKLTSKNSTTGTLAWKLTFSGLSGPVTSVQLRQGTKVLAKLCSSCKSGVHKSTALRGATFKAVSKNKATVTVVTKAHPTGELKGLLKLKASTTSGGGGGGGGNVAVTPAAVAAGKKLAEHFSCTGCHTIDGTKSTGPTWKGLAGSKVPQTDGTTVVATDAYLIRVITDPSTLKVKGYDSGVMSEVIAPGTVSDAEARNIVAYIKSLK